MRDFGVKREGFLEWSSPCRSYMDPSPPAKFGVDVEADDTTYTPKGRNRYVYSTRRLSGKMKIFQVGLKITVGS